MLVSDLLFVTFEGEKHIYRKDAYKISQKVFFITFFMYLCINLDKSTMGYK